MVLLHLLLYKLNAKYMPETEEQFFRLLETEETRQIARAAYNEESLDVVPVGAGEEVTIIEKLLKAEQLEAWAANKGFPWAIQREIDRRYLESLAQEDIDDILPPADWQPPGDPKAEAAMQELKLKKLEQDNDDVRLGMELQKLPLELAKMKLDLYAQQENIKDKTLKAEVDAAVKMADSGTKAKKVEQDGKKPQQQQPKGE